MKLKKVVVAACCISILLTACSQKKEDAGIEKENLKEESSMDGKYEMTAEQEELLCKISIDKEEVREGKLSKWQIEVLNQYDYAMDYLKKKYPSYTFQIINCEQKNKLNPYTTFGFVEESYPEGYYELYLYVEEGDDGNLYTSKDNFYGEIKEEEFAEKLQEMIQEEFGDNIEVKTNMSYVMGEEFGESLVIDDILMGKIEMPQSTNFIMAMQEREEEEYEEIVKKIEGFIADKGIYGTYMVKIVDEINQENILYKHNFFY